MIKKIIRGWVVSLLALFLASKIIGGFKIDLDPVSFIVVGSAYSLVHILVRPLLHMIFGPLNFISLGLFGLIIDAALLFGVTYFFPQIALSAWSFPGIDLSYVIIPPLNIPYLGVLFISAFFLNFVRSCIITLCE
jgi:uncharacterized membrane protein YvlD (DUF360 family)